MRAHVGLIVALLLELLLFALLAENFASAGNALEIVRASSELGLLALAATLVLSAGAIDLSVGSVMGLSAVVLGELQQHGVPIGAAVVAALATGGLCGFANGVLISRARVPPLLATLATMALVRGLAEGISGGLSVYTDFPPEFLFLGQGYWLGFLPPQLALLSLAALTAYWLAHRSPFGRRLSALGYSPEGAQHAALPIDRDRILVMTLSGFAAALAGVLFCAHVGQAKADVGVGYELTAITIAALGGTSAFGGKKSICGTLLALFAIATLQNGLLLAGQPSELCSILMGLLLVLAVAKWPARASSLWRAAPVSSLTLDDATKLDMKPSQLLLLIAAILTGALIIALSNVWAVREYGQTNAERSLSRYDRLAEAEPRLTVAMMPKNKSDPYFVSCRAGALEAARELDLELIWDGPAETDAARQNEVIEAWITREVDVIAVSVENAASISSVLRKARTKGIRVLTWDADAEETARDFLVNQATPEGIGRALADEAGRVLGGTGSFAIVTASLTAANQNAWIEHLRARLAERWPELSIAVIRPSDGLRDKALSETKNILRAYPEVRLIVTIAAAAVPGSAEAVKQEGAAVKVIGLSVPSLCRSYVHEGIIESIVLWNTVDLGYLSVHAAAQLARGKLDHYSTALQAGRLREIEIRDGQILLGEPFRFDKTNIDQFDF